MVADGDRYAAAGHSGPAADEAAGRVKAAIGADQPGASAASVEREDDQQAGRQRQDLDAEMGWPPSGLHRGGGLG